MQITIYLRPVWNSCKEENDRNEKKEKKIGQYKYTNIFAFLFFFKTFL